jgi:hypothetical protein
VGHIHAGITVGGLGLHFTYRFALQDSEMHVACQITNCVEKPAASRMANPVLKLQGVFFGSGKILVLVGSGFRAQ